MLEVLLTSLVIMQSEASTFGLEINWAKAKIQPKEAKNLKAVITPAGNEVKVVKNFMYLGCAIPQWGSSESEVRRCIDIARGCMKVLDENIWRSRISISPKLRLYKVFILPVLLYGADTWSFKAILTGTI